MNIHAKDFTKDDFLKVLTYHENYVKEYVKDTVLTFPNGVSLPLTYVDMDVDLIADTFLSEYSKVS